MKYVSFHWKISTLANSSNYKVGMIQELILQSNSDNTTQFYTITIGAIYLPKDL